jgi:hypothetical protein
MTHGNSTGINADELTRDVKSALLETVLDYTYIAQLCSAYAAHPAQAMLLTISTATGLTIDVKISVGPRSPRTPEASPTGPTGAS